MIGRALTAMEALADRKVIAEMALAGWRFERRKLPGGLDVEFGWYTYDPQGGFHGWNYTLAEAAWYAKLHMRTTE